METMTSDDVQLDAVLPALKSCPLFQALKDEHFSQILKISDVVHFAGEEVMVSEGTDADAFYVIIEGDAVIRLSSPAGEDVDVGKIPTGASFGEVGLLLGQKRTASVVALNNLTALKFSQKAFDTMFQKIPRFGVGLSRGLAHRLDEISGQIPLPKYDTRKGAPGTDVLNLIPKEFCQRHRVMPLEVHCDRTPRFFLSSARSLERDLHPVFVRSLGHLATPQGDVLGQEVAGRAALDLPRAALQKDVGRHRVDGRIAPLSVLRDDERNIRIFPAPRIHLVGAHEVEIVGDVDEKGMLRAGFRRKVEVLALPYIRLVGVQPQVHGAHTQQGRRVGTFLRRTAIAEHGKTKQDLISRHFTLLARGFVRAALLVSCCIFPKRARASASSIKLRSS